MCVLDKKKAKFGILFLTIFIILMIYPYGPINNIGHSLPRLSYFRDIAIYSPEQTTYDGPMSGYYPAVYGFEEVDDGSMPDDWEYSSTVSVVSEKSGHKKILDLCDNNVLKSVSANITFSNQIQGGFLEFWVCISTTSKAGYIKLYDTGGNLQIAIRLFNGWISYFGKYLSYNNLEQYAANNWYHIKIEWLTSSAIYKHSGFMVYIDGILMNEISSEIIQLFENLKGNNPEIKKLSFETQKFSFPYHFYVDAIGNSWDPDYDYDANRCEGIYISFSCSTPLIYVAYRLDDGSWVNIFPYYRIVIPMRIGGGTHTIQICGVDENGLIHVSAIRNFIMTELLDWGVDAINAEVVWGGSEDSIDVQVGNPAGQGVNVLVMDSGIDVDHPDLVSNYKGGYDFSAGGSLPNDEYGHGTHCSGIIGAVDNSIGILGIAPKVNLYAAKVIDLNTDRLNLTAAEKAIYWAINTRNDTDPENDIHIISMSFGKFSEILEQACQDAYNAGIVLVAASGNNFREGIHYPARYQQVIGIGAVKPKGNQFIRVSFSNYGDGLELVAPGYDIYSTLNNGSYKHYSGTSMACPMVAGVCALLLSKKPTLSPIEVSEAVSNSAREDLCFNYNSLEYGHGLVDAQGALNYNFEGVVDITSPSDGSSFYRGQNIKFQAYAFDHDIVYSVQYRINFGTWQNAQYNPNTNLWEWTWSDTNQYSTGTYTITCKLTDELGYAKQDSISIELRSSGGGCPILSIFNGNEYIEEGLLDIHNPDGIDEIYEHMLINHPVIINNRYYLRLTEHYKTISQIDRVELWGEMANGHRIKLPLLSAIHCELGQVRRYLWFSDDRKIEELGADHNNGISQSIDLVFLALQGLDFNKFIFIIEGNNYIIKY